EGRLFKELEIDNFLEEDFFSWLARPPAHQSALRVVRALFSLLRHYRLRELSEDVLKALYQELVDPETRHDLGEYYTPDWLAHRMINKMLDANPQGAMLDPACGSGTFLYLTIREKIARLGRTQETLAHILENVAGADIHPLAVITAKTNFILGLGDLLKQRRGPVSIPVYLADTVALPERKGYAYPARLYRKVIVHEELVENLTVYNLAVELAKDFAEENRGQPVSRENFQSARNFPAHQQNELVKSLFHVAQALKTFIEEGKDTIWAFILKNILKPLSFLKKFDFILGNPPWISFRYLDREYQKEVRGLITRTHHLLTGRGHLITHMEVGTLFLVRAADLYLKEGGTIGFVLPRAVMSADQHDELRRGTFRLSRDTHLRLTWQELWDCEQVSPLFNVPCCVLWAQKIKAVSDQRPLPGEVLAGELPRKNASLIESEAKLTVTPADFSLHRRGRRTFWAPWPATVKKGPSYYRDRFYQGATIVPRSFWFVQVKPSPLGFNPEAPPLVTDPRALKEAKKPYRDVCFSGQVERRFLYATLLSTDLLPFGHLPFRLVVLPLVPHEGRYRLLDAEQSRQKGFSYLSRWLITAEEEWNKRRGSKAGEMDIYERIDRFHGLTGQNPNAENLVIYNALGSDISASLIKPFQYIFSINDQKIQTTGVIIDYKLYFFETDNNKEAEYITSILNSKLVNYLIKPMQPRGLWGPRGIEKKVLELPIPQFDGTLLSGRNYLR
ncbi:MAG: N-6 DNA methylase, partial [Deltaproteobacteria bacterium]|nr:N-6 DNA methylase [Deltaproteobacteria bacterium]